MVVMDTETVLMASVSVMWDMMETTAPSQFVHFCAVARGTTVMENVSANLAGKEKSATSDTRSVRCLTAVAMVTVRMVNVSV